MMNKKFLWTNLICLSLILNGCSLGSSNNNNPGVTQVASVASPTQIENAIDLSELNDLSDPKTLDLVEEDICNKLTVDGDQQYVVDDVKVTYISQEYLDEIEYNSRENVYYGKKLSDVYKEFEGVDFVFTVNDKGETIVKEFEEYQEENYLGKILPNVAIAAGVIVVVVVVTVWTSGGATSTVIQTVAVPVAKKMVADSLSSGVKSAVQSGVAEYRETDGDIEAALKKAAVDGSDGLKMGAISGGVKRAETGIANKIIKKAK